MRLSPYFAKTFLSFFLIKQLNAYMTKIFVNFIFLFRDASLRDKLHDFIEILTRTLVFMTKIQVSTKRFISMKYLRRCIFHSTIPIINEFVD